MRKRNPELNKAEGAINKIKEGVEELHEIAIANVKPDRPDRFVKNKRALDNGQHDLLNAAASITSHIILADRAKERGDD
jgi:hypothetical protein